MDLTFIPTDEGWLYLAGVLDLCSRKVVGWSMADHMKAELVGDALSMAIVRRRSRPGLRHDRVYTLARATRAVASPRQG